jgi:NAD(P)-dependent dehydrogenase (short-subunit alcohol dehydrogenase family)
MAEEIFAPQHQDRWPGVESEMNPRPVSIGSDYKSADKLKNKVAVITGGDSGIGRAVAYHFAMEGADVAFTYLADHERGDAEETKVKIENFGQKALPMQGDIKQTEVCDDFVSKIAKEFGQIDVLVNNAGQQFEHKNFEDISDDEVEFIFKNNIESFFFMTKRCLKHMPKNSCVVNTASVTAYVGQPVLADYSSSKGSIVSFTRALARLLAPDIRVNAVAPGPVWTPLIVSSFAADEVARFGSYTPFKRPAQPAELAPAYVFLASNADSGFMTGETIHVNGGTFTSS